MFGAQTQGIFICFSICFTFSFLYKYLVKCSQSSNNTSISSNDTNDTILKYYNLSH